MKSLERITTALDRGIPDRVPVITFTNIAAGNLGRELTEYILQNADAQFEFPVREFLYNEFPAVGVKLSCDLEMTDDGWITRIYRSSDGTGFTDQYRISDGGTYRSYRKHIFHDISVIEKILSTEYLRPENNPEFIKDINHFCDIQDKHNTENEFCAVVINNPLSFLAANTDPVDMSLWTVLERDEVNRYIKEMTRRISEYADFMLDSYDMNCIFILGGSEYGIPPLMSPVDFEEFVFQNDKQIIDVLHSYGKKVLIHCHGKIAEFVSRFIQMGGDGIHPLEPVGPTGDCDIRDIKEKYGRDICLVGNIQYNDFQDAGEHEMESIVSNLMDAAKRDGGFILSPACPMFHDKTTKGSISRNIRAFIDSGIKFGKY